MAKRWMLVAELALAGALVGFLIGPESLDQFIGSTFRNTVVINIAAGAVIGALTGFLLSLMKPKTE